MKDDKGIIYIPCIIHPDGRIVLLQKQVCRSDEELLSLREYFSNEIIREKTTFTTSKSFQHYKYSSTDDDITVWVVEVHNSMYVTFRIGAFKVTLISKYLRSLGSALNRADKFIKEHK